MTSAETWREIADIAREYDQHLWAIGDALVAETDGSRKQLGEVRAELEANGHDVDSFSTLDRKTVTLSALYRTAKLFPPEKRQPIAWEWHAMARSERELLFIMVLLQDGHAHEVKKLLSTARRRGRLR
jgi:hypothetical protein